MKRRVMAVCRSTKKMRPKIASALDRYLWRVGDRTWVGYASTQCLKRIAFDLRHGASRNAAVAIYEHSSRVESRRPILIIGSRARFSADGLSPIMTRKATSTTSSPSEEAMRAILPMAALFHDIGKCTNMFQKKLRCALKTEKQKKKKQYTPDLIRHEIWSVLFLDACVAQSSGFQDFLNRCRTASLDFDQAAFVAASKTARLYEEAPDDCPLQDTKLGPLLELLAIDEIDNPLLKAIADIVLVHHRLPYLHKDEDGQEQRSIVPHVNKGGDSPGNLDESLFVPWSGKPIWGDRKWRRRLADSADRLKAVPHDAVLPDTATIMRTAFMVADHVGSKKSALLGRNLAEEDLLANTKKDNGQSYPADTVATHTERVHRATFNAIKLLFRDRYEMPALSSDEIPDSLRISGSTDSRFAWQAAAASAVRKLVPTSKGGFFACLLAGTGTGKTRAAPKILTAAAFSDADPARHRLRFVLGLGLRTLATQSGHDYVKDIQFPEKDIVVIIGGDTIRNINADFRNEEPSEEVGSLDYLSEVDQIRVETVEESSVNQTAEDWSLDRKDLPSDRDAQLPPIAMQFLQDGDTRSRTFRRLLASPIAVMTLDHLMSVADGRRSRHLAAALRVLSGDVILDEIDQYGEEDLAAISRFCYWVGAGGGRLIVMSATVPPDLAQDLHASYLAGWVRHAVTVGVSQHVHTLVCGDCPDSIQTNANGEAFPDLFDLASSRTCKRLDTQHPLRLYKTLSVEKRDEVPDVIWRTVETMHECHAVTINARHVSVGLVRITRIKDLRRIFCDLINRTDASCTKTLFLCLHSRMLRGHRTLIEKALNTTLTRTGKDPNAGLKALMENQATAFWSDNRVTHFRIVVVTSPVIETGNDIDFDYAIIDPLNARSIVQTAGRVNRHRCIPADCPNIAVLSVPLPRYDSSSDRLEMPGIETEPFSKTGVCGWSLENPATFPDSFILSDNHSRVDAGWILNEDMQGEITKAESEMRGRFGSGQGLDIRDYVKRSAFRLSASFGYRRQFRRRTRPDLEIFLERKNRSLQFLGYPQGRSREPSRFPAKFMQCDLPHILLKLTQDDLDGMIADNGMRDNVVQLPYVHADMPEHLIIDGVLGVMTETEVENLPNRNL